ncbi:hypothetical protein Syun_018139 [Stephania yunnanensis]|uniref:Uncharacterized protein n=1 Tax=Stephania yunnanensis TaxID=152371 RepID=A0AAP0IRQ0_9MAGN
MRSLLSALPRLSSLPDLKVREIKADLESASGEFDADGGLGLQAELVASESGEEIRLPDARVADRTTSNSNRTPRPVSSPLDQPRFGRI